ncbi:MaoC/PaaZ C-terminal domain-containing protein [Brevibacterium daeguense]|uniref:MaoC/PaaZ C-terminal domain-containing protein n=1 Tax=Brevibacterium daeguense TaxID=909936 RepID=A0ABP8ENY4_9MICO|nr:MaoC/PaaZ C-terminal domain-containing protein [Brevibacterium daeguense]
MTPFEPQLSNSMLPVYGRAMLGMLPMRRKSSAHVPSRQLTSTAVIDPQDVAEFARAVGSRVENTVSPAYLHVLGFPLSMRLMTDPGFPLPVMGMVHVRNVFTQYRPVLVGEEVTVAVRVAAPREHSKGTAIDLQTTGRVDGRHAFAETSTYLAKGQSLPGAAPARETDRTPFTAPVPTALWSLKKNIGLQYARVSGDYNPIHLNALAGKAFGFPSSIAHGMYTAARALAAADVRLPAFEWTVEFATPIVLPADVAFRVTSDVPGGAREFAVWNPRTGKPHVLSSVRPVEAAEDEYDI